MAVLTNEQAVQCDEGKLTESHIHVSDSRNTCRVWERAYVPKRLQAPCSHWPMSEGTEHLSRLKQNVFGRIDACPSCRYMGTKGFFRASWRRCILQR